MNLKEKLGSIKDMTVLGNAEWGGAGVGSPEAQPGERYSAKRNVVSPKFQNLVENKTKSLFWCKKFSKSIVSFFIIRISTHVSKIPYMHGLPKAASSHFPRALLSAVVLTAQWPGILAICAQTAMEL